MAQAALVLGAAAWQGYAAHEAGQAQQSIAKSNAKLLDRSAADALRRGDEEAIASRRRTKLLVGEQRAAAAAQGLDVNTGVVADLQEQARAFGEEDEATIRRNAWREAWGIRTQARNMRTEGRYAARAGTNQAIGTGLSGLGSAYGYWQEDKAVKMRR